MMENLSTITYSTSLPEDGSDTLDVGVILGMITYSLLGIAIMFSNTVVMVTYWTERRVWQNISHLFILHLSIADFLVGFSIFPLTIAIMSAGRWPFGEIPCKILSAFNYMVTYIPGLFILAVTTFRLFLVTNFSRENVVQRKHVMWVIFVLWSATISIYLFLAFAWPGITGSEVVDYDSECLLEYVYHTKMSLIMIFFEFVIPFVFLLSISFGLFWKIRQRSRGVRNTSWRVAETCTNISPPRTLSPDPVHVDKQDCCTNGQRRASEYSVKNLNAMKLQEKGESASTASSCDVKESHEFEERCTQVKEKPDLEVKGNIDLCRNTGNHFEVSKVSPLQQSSASTMPRVESHVVLGGSSIKNRVSTMAEHGNKATQQSGKDSIRGHRKAAIMLFAIVAAFAICWLPYVILSLVFLVYPDIVSSSVFEAISGTLYLNSLINPALYGMTNVHFRRGFIKVLHLPRRWLP